MERLLSFFFQAEDGIRDGHVTGVQTCALPISNDPLPPHEPTSESLRRQTNRIPPFEEKGSGTFSRNGPEGASQKRYLKIGRASCRERGESEVGAGGVEKKRGEGRLGCKSHMSV